MKSKLLLTIPVIALATILTGCTMTVTNTNANFNAAANTNVAVENTNTAVNENTNVSTTNTNTSAHADWKTYTDPEKDYSFQYPSDWNVRVYQEGDPGEMGVSLGTIIISSDVCRIFGNTMRAGSIEDIKSTATSDQQLSPVYSDSEVEGIKYYTTVNESGDKAFVYGFDIHGLELGFNLVENINDEQCSNIFDEIMMTLSAHS
ncbi:MAG: hypothetical protein KIH62_003560 [Candidatus Kerfeldbacteria bacterium]|nr:hypothetical protein [Candidatus Kerfeldbacteria bacterium]